MQSCPAGQSPVTARLEAMLARALERRIPLSGSLAMTYRCHLRCVHCYLGDERLAESAAGEQDTAFWLSVVDQVADAGCLDLLMTGGEPLLRPDFAEVYSRAKNRGLLVSVFTNGTLVSDETAALFRELPPSTVEVTLYGASPEVYEAVTGSPGSFARSLRGVDRLLAAGVRVGLKAVILRGNAHEVGAMRAMAADRGVGFRVDPGIFPGRDGDRGPLEHRVPAEAAVAIELEDAEVRRKTAEQFERTRSSLPEERLFPCMAGRTAFHVDPDGTLLPCLMVRTPGFDLRRGTFHEGWDGIVDRFVHQPAAPGLECNTCEARFVCGSCPAQSQMETGDYGVKSEYTCRVGHARVRQATGDEPEVTCALDTCAHRP